MRRDRTVPYNTMAVMKIRFDNPPINELVIAAYFNPPLSALRNEHIGLFWSKIREEFPTVEQRAPVGDGEAFMLTGNEVFPMPRFWFVAEDQVNLIQVQKNAFMLNWRRRNGEHPHFEEHLKPAFDKYYRMFEEFVQTETSVMELKIDRCELAYINTVEPCEYWQGPQDTINIIPSLAVPDLGITHGAAPAFNCAYVFFLASDLQLQVSIRNGESTAKPGLPVLIFEISATGRIQDKQKSIADSWFRRAHDAIVECFLSVTSEDIRNKYWSPVGVIK